MRVRELTWCDELVPVSLIQRHRRGQKVFTSPSGIKLFRRSSEGATVELPKRTGRSVSDLSVPFLRT